METGTLLYSQFDTLSAIRKTCDSARNGFFWRILTVTGSTYSVSVTASGANLTGVRNPVPVSLTIGDDAGTTSVQARF